MKRWLHVLVLMSTLVAVGLIGGAAAPVASAVDCYKWGCDNTMPNTTGCSADAITVRDWEYIQAGSTAEILGYVRLRYSPTCKTAWSSVKSECVYGDLPVVIKTRVTRTWDGSPDRDGDWLDSNTETDHVACGVTAWGKQVFVPNPEFGGKARAWGSVDVQMGSSLYGSRYSPWWSRPS